MASLDVAIVGAGPVGATVAALSAAPGLRKVTSGRQMEFRSNALRSFASSLSTLKR